MIGRLTGRLEEGVVSLLLVAMTLLVFLEVVLRFVFNTGFLWMQEVTLHISAWLVLFGASYGVRVGAHIGVDAVVRLIPPHIRRWVSAVAGLACLAYVGLFIYGSWVYLEKMYQIGLEMEDLPVPKWLSQSILLIGFVLLGIRFLQFLWQLARGRVTGFNLADEAAEALKEREAGEGRP